MDVWRVRDPSLDRTMVMKVLRAEYAQDPTARTRFLAEAQATAQLDHPAIVLVHELGDLSDGRAYFTMREVRGRTLTQAIRALHLDPDQAASGGFHRLLVHFQVALLAAAREQMPASVAQRAEAGRLRVAGDAALEALEAWAPEEVKSAAWALLDAADALERRVNVADAAVDSQLRAALGHAPNLVPARVALIERRLADLSRAEFRGPVSTGPGPGRRCLGPGLAGDDG